MSNGARSFNRAFALAVVVVWAYSLLMANLMGKDAEAKMTLDALGKANYAMSLLAEYRPIGDRQLAMCMETNTRLRDLNRAAPIVWTP